ncbi:hypothetical protein ACFYW6_34135 [Streptomyces sp. NPDC002659]|uniref:hypothetical protein n=1 Tax=Streptomyces sp. NPDC002659 TaxID=3364656 RepID=UPI0036BD174F
MTPHIGFADECDIDDADERSAIIQALSDVPVSAGNQKQDGHWSPGTSSIKVLQKMKGGRSGSQVLLIEAEALDTSLQVAKLMTHHEAVSEWDAYKNGLRERAERFNFYVPIVAVSASVLNGRNGGFTDRAVIYQHVQDQGAVDGVQIQSLEDLVSASIAGDIATDSSVPIVKNLMKKLQRALHNGARASSDRTDLAGENKSLGFDLELMVDGADGTEDGSLVLRWGRPSEKDLTDHNTLYRDVLKESAKPSKNSSRLKPGNRTRFWLDAWDFEDGKLTGQYGATTVRIHLDGEAQETGGAAIKEVLAKARTRDVSGPSNKTPQADIFGRVQVLRSERWSNLINDHLNGPGSDFVEEVDTLQCDGALVDHPVRSLLRVLDSPPVPRTLSAVHGDLNPRNIIFCDSAPYLIDYASAKRSGRTLADLAWLEVCLFRDCAGPLLSWAELLAVGRLLALLTDRAGTWPAERTSDAASRFVEVCSNDDARVGSCLALLWEVRQAAVSVALSTVGGSGPEHYFQELTLAACRTLKWESSQQTSAQVRASVAIAGVASEALRGGPQGILAHCKSEHAQAVRDIFLSSTEQYTWADADLLLKASAAGGEASDASASEIAPRLFGGPLSSIVKALREQCSEDKKATPYQYGTCSYIDLAGRVLSRGESVQQGEGALALAPESCLQLLRNHEAVVVIADSGAGKTAVTREFRSRLLGACATDAQSAEVLRLPLSTTAQWLSDALDQTPQPSLASILSSLAPGENLTEARMDGLLNLGAVHLTVDKLHEVDRHELLTVASWLKKLRDQKQRLHVVVCQRTLDYQPELFGWPAIAIHKVREQQARDYIQRELQHRSAPRRPGATTLENRLFHDPEAVALRDLAGKPLFLSMLVRHYQEHGEVPVNPGALVHDYVSHLLRSFKPPENSTQSPMELLKTLVRKMGNGSFLERASALAALTDREDPSPDKTLAALVDTTAIVSEASSRITFCNPLVHAYFAAAALAEDANGNLPEVKERILTFSWRDAAVLLVADPDTAPETVSAVLEAAVQASPWYGALLLQAIPETRAAKFAENRRAFLAAQHEVLQSTSSGRPAWQQSAYALAKYGDREAMGILADVACSGSQTEAVVAALDGLVMMRQWFVPDSTATLQQALQRLLETGTRAPAPVLVRALRSVRTVGLRSLTGYAWSHVVHVRPWPVVHEAWETLTDLGVLPDQTLRGVYAAACKDRLAEIDTTLAQTAATAKAKELNEERMTLLKYFAKQGDVSTLLRYRFRAGLAENSEWPQMLDAAAAVRQESPEPDLVAATLLNPGSPDTWREQLASPGELWTAVIAAHRLLAAGEIVEAPLLRRIAHTPDAERLALVAAFVHCLQPSDVSSLNALIDPYLAALTPDMVEPLSCLVSAARTLEESEGLKLAVRVHEALITHDLEEQAVHWPWCTTWRRILPMRAETGRFLEERCLDKNTLRSLMGSIDVLLDAPRLQPVYLSEDMRRTLKELQPASADGVEAHEYVLLAASAGLYESLEFVQQVATSQHNLKEVITHSHGIHGRIEVSLAAHAIAAVGYLGQLARRLDEGGRPEAEDSRNALQQILSGPHEYHNSVRRARCVALGFWGEWQPLLSTLLWMQDPVLEQAARNVVSHWIPQPSNGAGEKLHMEIAKWITRRLQDTKLPASTRAVLTEIRDNTQNTLRRYVQA